ncbi:uncharacterized protein LOC123566698 [Mercenaria mercenaria]|uniref:uncharacterized protein LOC123566698 n=1 Tax=Mercenaria mercenaria TaxID=6596 RepID=UPI00234F1216|nr:uncharacterized protein LOC123566698 [Mercenaria mercenaria]
MNETPPLVYSAVKSSVKYRLARLQKALNANRQKDKYVGKRCRRDKSPTTSGKMSLTKSRSQRARTTVKLARRDNSEDQNANKMNACGLCQCPQAVDGRPNCISVKQASIIFANVKFEGAVVCFGCLDLLKKAEALQSAKSAFDCRKRRGSISGNGVSTSAKVARYETERKTVQKTSRQKAISSLKNSKYATAFKHILKRPRGKTAFYQTVYKMCKSEIFNVKGGPLSKKVSRQSLEEFSWDEILPDVEEKCPTLYNAVLGSIMKSKGQSELNKVRSTFGTALSMILHKRHPTRFKFVQGMNSIQMWLSNCSNNLFDCFNKMGICTSSNTARCQIDQLVKEHDNAILHLKKQTEKAELSQKLNRVNRPLFPPEVKQNDKNGFSICWDNVQIEVHARHQSTESQNKMMMWAMSYAAINRIGFFHLRDDSTVKAVDLPLETFLPDQCDIETTTQRMVVIVSRILTHFLPNLKQHYQQIPISHIQHKFSRESSLKSEIVNLGVMKENPSSIAGVIQILENLQQYVPRKTNGRMIKIVCHGDGLSVERHRDAQRARAGSLTEEGRLQGLVSTPQEFHKRCITMQDTMNKLCKGGQNSRGTFANIKNVFDHRNVTPKDVTKSFNHCVDFIWFTTSGYICLLALKILEMETINSVPQQSPFQGTEEEKKVFLAETAKKIVQFCLPTLQTAQDIADSVDNDAPYTFCSCKTYTGEDMVQCSNTYCSKGKWFHLSCIADAPEDEEEDWYCCVVCETSQNSVFCKCKKVIRGSRMVRCHRDTCPFGKWFHLRCVELETDPVNNWYCSDSCRTPVTENLENPYTEDGVYEYSKAAVYRGLLDLVHQDIIRENDGPAMMSLWRMNMVDFYSNNHHKYLQIGHMLLAGISGFLPQRLSNEILWNRTVNIKGGEGRNIAMDLANEFINRDFKDNLKHCHGRYTDTDVSRRSKMVGALGCSLKGAYAEAFGETHFHQTNKKTFGKYENDVAKFIEEYKDDNLFNIQPGRHHQGFEGFSASQPVSNPENLIRRLQGHSKNIDLQKLLQN